MSNLNGKTVLVTGANRGIGLALVKKALENNADKVYATYRSESNRSTLEALSERVVPIQLDLSDPASIEALAQAITELDILVNNAGIFTGANLLDDTEAQLRNDLETNLFGTLAVTKALLPALKNGGSASIANISSVAAFAAMPSFGGYSVSKVAVHSMTQSFRAKLKEDGISVHGVYPGPVATRMTEGMPMETTPASVVAGSIFDGIEGGVGDIFPDGMSQQVGPLFLSAPKQVEQAFAAY